MKTLVTFIKMKIFRSLRGKLILLFLSISLLPLLTMGILAYTQTKKALETQTTHQLIAVRDIKANQIERYFRERLEDVKLMSNNPTTIAAVRAFHNAVETDMKALDTNEGEALKHARSLYLNKPNLVNANDGSAYSAVHAQYHSMFKEYQKAHGYHDIFLVEPHIGAIVYTVEKESDFGTSLINGLYANTNLGEAFKETAAATRRYFTLLKDFAHYAPSNGAASFVASPIFDESQLLGVLAFQLPINQIDSLMQEGSGLGETGETILISSDDFILRSNSRFFKDSTLLKRKVDTEATRASAAGKTGVKTIIDYRGEPTLIAHTPLSIPNVKWSLNAKIDEAEAFAVVHQILTLMLLIIGIIAVIVVTVALFIGKSIVKPILTMTKIAHQLAAGNMKQTIEIKTQDEIGLMGNAFQQMIAHLGQVIDDIVKVSKGLAAGNLHVTPQAEYQGDLLQVKNALETGLSNLRLVVEDIVQISQRLVEGKRRVIAKAEYNGDFIPIKDSLETASVKLAETTAQNNIQNWLKTGQTQLNEKMRGEQDIIQLAKNIITFLAKYLEMPVGVFYLLEEREIGTALRERSQTQTENGPVSETARLKLVASYAYTHRKGIRNEILIGEGLVGQAALEQEQILITNVPEDYYIQIKSGLGKALPRNVLIQPLKYENALKGVIELASFKTITDIQLEWIAQITPSIGIAVNTAESRYRVQALLQQSQTQTEELQTQAEELQTQSEELQTQQEELSQTNEALEQRTKELEQQKNDIQAKNSALEQSQHALETKMQELKQASQYKSEFLANMSHELRTPLNSLLILAQLLADNKTGNLTDKQIEYAKTIHSAGSDLLNLINDILDLSKVEAGKMEVHFEELLLTDLVERFENKCRPVAENKGLAFHITVAKDLPPVINTDVQRLQQIINNLLSNAFKFTTTGEIKLTMQRPSTGDNLTKIGLEVAKTLAFSVTDTGIGIPEDKKRVIFEAFQQVDGTTSRRYGGTGLGLSISRQFARLLGGELVLHSEPGNGSTFTLYLPETRPSKEELVQNSFKRSEEQQFQSPDIQDSESPTPSPTEKGLTPTGNQVPPVEKTGFLETQSFEKTGFLETTAENLDDRDHLTSEDKSLLIIEDDPKFSSIIADLARQKGFKCLIAENGRTGLQLAEECQPHIIILDVGLPQLDGWTVMEKLKDNPDTRHIPVHFISASEPSLDATKMGAIGYLHKPVNMAQLGEAFKKIEQFITKTMKNVLVVVDNEMHQQQIQHLVSSENVQITLTATKAAALQHLQEASFDCIILDMDIEQRSGTGLLEQMQNQQDFCQTPLIIYTERELTSSEEALLLRCADKLPLKSVRSPERLLDEVTLFLHQLEANLPVEKRNMLKMVHDKAAILKHKKVLIVDDDVRNVFALATVLEDKDMEVVCGKNGKEALALLKKHEEIAIVLMDIMMPEMDGYEAIQAIRKQPSYRKLPIIALTAKAMKGDKAKCIEAGANDYLSKPVDTEKLISLMRVWLYR
jgi:signal transduction histidine kinase/CheY-like chemotaxis protein/HAMP domain-containing protein